MSRDVSTKYVVIAVVVGLMGLGLLGGSYINADGVKMPSMGWLNLFGGVILIGLAIGIYGVRKGNGK